MPRKSSTRLPSKFKPREAPVITVEGEQKRIRDWLHKSVGQTITGARFLLSAMARGIPAGDKKLTRDFRHLEKQLAQASEELHELIKSLQPYE